MAVQMQSYCARGIVEDTELNVALLLPAGFENLSFAPLAVFEAANIVLGRTLYELHVVSPCGELTSSSLGMEVKTKRVDAVAVDTLLVGGRPNTDSAAPEFLGILKRSPSRTRRVAAISTGAFLLGEAGLLDGRRATTHWMFGKQLQERYPKCRVELDRIFIEDGQIWSSAGMTAGIDLALSLIERDIGRERTREAARMMVIHHRRAGGQSQHSALLEIDAKSDRVQNALQFARKNLTEELSVEQLAAAACLSPRQFSRVFRAETGLSPAKAIENLRVEAARFLLEQSRVPVETIAEEAGFGHRERMRRTFLRTFEQTPQAIRNAAFPLASI
jgi:transcriptional regulator GlxA family with amidase domain